MEWKTVLRLSNSESLRPRKSFSFVFNFLSLYRSTRDDNSIALRRLGRQMTNLRPKAGTGEVDKENDLKCFKWNKLISTLFVQIIFSQVEKYSGFSDKKTFPSHVFVFFFFRFRRFHSTEFFLQISFSLPSNFNFTSVLKFNFALSIWLSFELKWVK